MRPNIVWFGEYPFRMDEVHAALGRCGYFVSIGTSWNVYPVAAFTRWVSRNSAKIELNLTETRASGDFDDSRIGKAGDLVPAWTEEMCVRYGIKA